MIAQQQVKIRPHLHMAWLLKESPKNRMLKHIDTFTKIRILFVESSGQ